MLSYHQIDVSPRFGITSPPDDPNLEFSGRVGHVRYRREEYHRAVSVAAGAGRDLYLSRGHTDQGGLGSKLDEQDARTGAGPTSASRRLGATDRRDCHASGFSDSGRGAWSDCHYGRGHLSGALAEWL